MNKASVHPRVSVSPLSTWSWSVDEDLAFFAAEGISAIGMPMNKFGPEPEADFAKIRASGFTLTSVSGSGGCLVDSGERTLEALKPYIDATTAMGGNAFYCVTGPTPARMPTDEAFARFIECIAPARSYAEEQGVALSIENNSVSTRQIGFVHTLAGSAELCREAGLGICLELQNCWYEPNLPRLFRESIDLLTLIQVSDFLVDEPLKMNRRVPGDGSMPLEWMIGGLLEAGYQGYFEIEVVGPAIEKEGYIPAIRRSVEWLSNCLTKLGA